jgi:hypothetical protein
MPLEGRVTADEVTMKETGRDEPKWANGEVKAQLAAQEAQQRQALAKLDGTA